MEERQDMDSLHGRAEKKLMGQERRQKAMEEFSSFPHLPPGTCPCGKY